MSAKNRDAKRAARERLLEERKRREARARRIRQLVIIGSVVAVLVIAGVVGVVVQNMRSNDEVTPPAHATGKNNTVLPVGDRDAPVKLTVYEDFRCPACGQFEAQNHENINTLLKQGKVRVDYHIASFIDNAVGMGEGSKQAANAAACAMDTGGRKKFLEYHNVLYKNQPDEQDDAYGEPKKLLQLAGKVKGLTTDEFTSCVKDNTYESWVKDSQKDFDKSGHTSTPTVLLDGKVVKDAKHNMKPSELKKKIEHKAEQASK